MAKLKKAKGSSIKVTKDTTNYNIKGTKKVLSKKKVGRPRLNIERGNLNFKPTKAQLEQWHKLEELSGLSGIALLTYLIEKETKRLNKAPLK